jgi:RNA:NAD 2'-phosphotransferase (TPT1/KptA family)
MNPQTQKVTEAAAKALVTTWEKRRFTLTPVRFVEEGGTRMGHTVVCDWKATYVKGA